MIPYTYMFKKINISIDPYSAKYHFIINNNLKLIQFYCFSLCLFVKNYNIHFFLNPSKYVLAIE